MVAADTAWRLPGRPLDPRGPRRPLVRRRLRRLAVADLLAGTGFSAFAIGSIITSTLVGSALLTLWVGMIANQHPRRRMLLAACLLMAVTGLGFMLARDYWPILIIDGAGACMTICSTGATPGSLAGSTAAHDLGRARAGPTVAMWLFADDVIGRCSRTSIRDR